MSTPDKESFVITLSGTHPAADVAKDLSQHGFEVGNVLDAIGVVTGTAHASALANLRTVPGVADISEDHVIDIGPPGAAIS